MEILVLGNSLAALTAIETIKKIDMTSNITLVSKEPWSAYSRPLIAEYLTGEKTYEEILYRPERFYETHNVTKIMNHAAIHLDAELQRVQLDNDQELSYDHLLIATGSSTVRPNIPGIDRKGVYCFWTLDDAKQIAMRAKSTKTAVVVGAGLVGMSAAYALSALGLQVIVVELLNQILPQNLDISAASIVQRYMEQNGLQVVTGQRLQEIHGFGDSGYVTDVLLDNGPEISCELVITCTGVRPAVDFLQDSGVQIESGVLVNKFLQTNYENIYAAGDVVQPFDPVFQTNRVVANLPNAREQGRIAGMNLAGVQQEYQGGIAMTSMRYFGIPWTSVGALSCSQEACHEVIGICSESQGLYEKILVQDDTILGAIFVGDITQAGIVTNLIKKQTKLGTIVPNLDDRGQFFEHLRSSMLQDELEGPPGHIEWKKVIGSDKRYKKKIDKEEWRKKELTKV